MKLTEIQELIKFVAKAGVNEVELETKDIKITIKAPGKGSKGQASEPTTVIHQVPMGATAMPMQQMPAIQQSAPQQPAAPQKQQKEETKKEAEEDNDKYITVKSPMIGTFYRRPSPDKDPFAEVGDTIKKGDVVCVIEAMKLFNEIEAEVSGKIVKFLAEDNSPVEYDQPLFLVDPA